MTRRAPIPTPEHSSKCEIYAAYLARPRHDRVLELGPYDGVDTAYLARHAESVIAIEARVENLEAVRYHLDRQGAENVTLLQGNLEVYDLAALGRFDCCWATGVLYHLPHPLGLIQRIAQVTDRCYGWTHLAVADEVEVAGYRGSMFREGTDPLSGLSPASFWLLPEEFLSAWWAIGWRCEFLTQPAPHKHGGLSAQFMADLRRGS
jgi:SAM-dependent methyltransferase